MVRLCSIKTCKSRVQLKRPTTFELPKSSRNAEKWINFLKKQKIDYDSSKSYFLCPFHFKRDMIMVTNRRLRLHFNAYPIEVSYCHLC